MLAFTVSLTWTVLFLAVAIVLFVLAAFPRIAKRRIARPWMIPLGLASFAAAFLVRIVG